MGTTSFEEIYWEMYGLKRIFGNRRNYYRYLAQKDWNNWNHWLIGLGYHPE